MGKKKIKRDGRFPPGQVPWNKGKRMVSSQWRGGLTKERRGYIHKIIGYRDDGTAIYRGLHRIVMEEYLGRPLLQTEHIHHIDGNRSNNDVKNLELITPKKHNNIHQSWLLRKFRPCQGGLYA